MTVNEITPKLIERAVKILEGTGILEVIPGRNVPGSGLAIKTRVKNKSKKEYSFYFDIKSSGQPRFIRMAVNQLKDLLAGRAKSYGMIGAPYLSDGLRDRQNFRPEFYHGKGSNPDFTGTPG